MFASLRPRLHPCNSWVSHIAKRPSIHRVGFSSEAGQQPHKAKRGFLFWTAVGVTGTVAAAQIAHRVLPEEHVAWATTVVLAKIPFRLTSYAWGYLANVNLPHFLRSPIYSIYARLFGCNLDEMARPIDEYSSLGAFFARSLRSGAREWAAAKPGSLGSPVDGTVYFVGKVNENTLEQVKGVSYTLPMFLGEDSPIVADAKKGKHLYHATIYLAPGDYHGIHSPTDWVVKRRRHIPGRLLPVAPFVVNRVSGIFAANERVVLEGEWLHGHFTLTPVGATNVGSIKMKSDELLSTNSFPKPKDLLYERVYENGGVKMERGQEVAFFHMGSTVVLIFECPSNEEFIFNIKPGDKVRLGQPLGVVTKIKPTPGA